MKSPLWANRKSPVLEQSHGLLKGETRGPMEWPHPTATPEPCTLHPKSLRCIPLTQSVPQHPAFSAQETLMQVLPEHLSHLSHVTMELTAHVCTSAAVASSSNCQPDSQDTVGFTKH